MTQHYCTTFGVSRTSEIGHKAAHAVDREQETTREYVLLNKIYVIAIMLIAIVRDCDVPKLKFNWSKGH